MLKHYVLIILLLFSTTAFSQSNKLPVILPVKGVISSFFGYRISPFTGKRAFHEGIDIVAPLNTPIRAPADGVITKIGKMSGIGHFIIISHAGQVHGRYGHVKKIKVKVGQKVKRGDILARIGMTGRTTGPHLHYELRIQDTLVDPITFLFEIPRTHYKNENVGGEF